jgi:hypothetical protein
MLGYSLGPKKLIDWIAWEWGQGLYESRKVAKKGVIPQAFEVGQHCLKSLEWIVCDGQCMVSNCL